MRIVLVFIAFVAIVFGTIKVKHPPRLTYIDRLPYTITKPGVYHLRQSLSSDSHGIIIDSDAVRIEGHGFSIQCTSSGICHGIYSNNHSHISIDNLKIADFYGNIFILGDYDKLSSPDTDCNQQIHLSRIHSDRARFRGIRLDAQDSTIEHCKVTQTGGTYTHDRPYIMGIEVYGPRNRLYHNQVDVVSQLEAGECVGISLSDFTLLTSLRFNTISRVRGIGLWLGGNTVLDDFKSNQFVDCDHMVQPTRFSSP